MKAGFLFVIATGAALAVALIVACNLTDGLQGGADDDAGGGALTDGGEGGLIVECGAVVVDLLRSAENCGACGHVCPNGPNSVAACFDGGCDIVCTNEVLEDCDKDASNGCETNTNTSRTHCGRCNGDCLGGLCAGGACQPLLMAAGAEAPVQIVEDETFVYGISAFGSVTKSRKDAGTPSLNVMAAGGASPQSPAPRITIGNNTLYWTSANQILDGGTVIGDGGIYEYALDGGKGSALLTTTVDRPIAIAVTNNVALWSEGLTTTANANGTIKSCKLPSSGLGCGKTNTVALQETGAIQSLAVSGPALYWANGGTPPLYGDSAVRKCTYGTSPCTPDNLVTSPLRPFDLALDGNTAYWTARESVASCLLAGCSKMPFIIDNTQLDPNFVVAYGGSLYFTTRDGAIKSIPKAGPPTAERILYQQRGTTPWDIVVDADAVYWTDLSGKDGTPGTALYKIAR